MGIDTYFGDDARKRIAEAVRRAESLSRGQIVPVVVEKAAGNGPLPLEAVLPDGFTREVCPAAVDWWREAANALGCGKLVWHGCCHDARDVCEVGPGRSIAPDVGVCGFNVIASGRGQRLLFRQTAGLVGIRCCSPCLPSRRGRLRQAPRQLGGCTRRQPS